MLTRDQLLKPKTTTIEVDGGSLLIRALSAEYAMGLRGRDLQGADIFQVIADSIVQENGETMLTGAEVGTLAISTLEQIVKQVFEFNALGKKAVEDATAELKKTEDLIMNSAGHWEPPQSQ
jgi:hypothetical protein